MREKGEPLRRLTVSVPPLTMTLLPVAVSVGPPFDAGAEPAFWIPAAVPAAAEVVRSWMLRSCSVDGVRVDDDEELLQAPAATRAAPSSTLVRTRSTVKIR